MLLCGELLEQIMIGCVGGMQTLGQPVAEPMLMGKKQPNVSTSVLGNTCREKKGEKLCFIYRTLMEVSKLMYTCTHVHTPFTLAECMI